MKSTRQRVLYISQGSSSIFTEGESEVGSTHTYIESDIVLYLKRKIYIYFSDFNSSATSLQ